VSAPRWARALVARAADPGRVDEALGDLDEAHRIRRERRGPLLATLLTGLEALDMAVVLRWQRRRILHRVRRTVPPDLKSARRRRMPPVSWLDFKLGVRMLARYPGMTAVGGTAMALGIALGAGGLHLFGELVAPARSYPEPDRIVGIQNVDTRRSAGAYRAIHDFERWREELRTVEQVGAMMNEELNLAPEGDLPTPALAVRVSAAAFALTDTPPLLGRPLLAADEAAGAAPVLVLSYRVWSSRFAADPDVVGRTAALGGEPATVVGVMPEGFQIDVPSGDFIYPWGQDVWTPFRFSSLDYAVGEGPSLRVFGRLAPGAAAADAQAEMDQLGRLAAAEWPDTHQFLAPRVVSFSHPFGAGGINLLQLMSLSSLLVVLVMLLLCANVALMMYARAATRESEIVVRSALGASRARIVGQLFAEATALAAVATVAGLLGAAWGVRWVWSVLDRLAQAAGASWPPIDLVLGNSTLLTAIALAFVGAVVAGVLPGFKVTRNSGHVPLQQTAARGGAPKLGRVWGAIIVTQVALTTMIIPLAVVLGYGAWSTTFADVGVPAGEYLTAQMEMDGDAASQWLDEEQAFSERYAASYGALRERLATEPGVLGVTVAESLPGAFHRRWRFDLEEPPGGVQIDPADFAQVVEVDAGFFDALGVDLLAGRAFGAGDFEEGARAVIVNESFVDRYLAGGSAIGHRLRYRAARTAYGPPLDGPEPEWLEIVGVVRDVLLYGDPGIEHNAGIYQPLRAGTRYPLRMAVHVLDGPGAFVPRLRQTALEVAPALRLTRTVPLDLVNEANRLAYASWSRVLIFVGGFALLLTNAGIFAIVSFTVARRTREIGVRVALGADATGIVTAVLARMARRVAIGVALGSALGLTFAYAASEGALELTAAVWLGVALYLASMVAVCMAACIVPTRRALAIQPTEALAAEG